MDSRSAWLLAIAGLLLAGGILVGFVDDALVEAAQVRNGALDALLIALNHWTVPWLLICTGLLALRWRRTDLQPYALAVALSYALASGMKWIVMRPRPSVDALVSAADSSFPSRHALVLFAVATVISVRRPHWSGAAFGIAAAVSLARVFAGVHYASDSFVGAALGILVGLAATLSPQRR